MERGGDVWGVALAGGAGRRMGAPKPLLPLAGRPLIGHVVEALSAHVAGVTIVTNDPAGLAHLGLPTVPDAEPGRGPLMGLYSGLLACPTTWALVVACDAPFLAAPLLRALVAGRRPGAMTLPVTARGTQPLPGVYAASLAPHLAALLAVRRAALRDLTSTAPAALILPDDVRALDPEGLSFTDLDTPEDLAAAQAIALSRRET